MKSNQGQPGEDIRASESLHGFGLTILIPGLDSDSIDGRAFLFLQVLLLPLRWT